MDCGRLDLNRNCSFNPLSSYHQGLRPCTAESNRKPGGPEQGVSGPENQQAPQDRKQEGQQVRAFNTEYSQDEESGELRALSFRSICASCM